MAEQDWQEYPFAPEAKARRDESGINLTDSVTEKGRELLGFTDGEPVRLASDPECVVTNIDSTPDGRVAWLHYSDGSPSWSVLSASAEAQRAGKTYTPPPGAPVESWFEFIDPEWADAMCLTIAEGIDLRGVLVPDVVRTGITFDADELEGFMLECGTGPMPTPEQLGARRRHGLSRKESVRLVIDALRLSTDPGLPRDPAVPPLTFDMVHRGFIHVYSTNRAGCAEVCAEEFGPAAGAEFDEEWADWGDRITLASNMLIGVLGHGQAGEPGYSDTPGMLDWPRASRGVALVGEERLPFQTASTLGKLSTTFFRPDTDLDAGHVSLGDWVWNTDGEFADLRTPDTMRRGLDAIARWRAAGFEWLDITRALVAGTEPAEIDGGAE